MSNIKNIDTIIFDAGGVLIYINEFRNSILRRVLSSMGYCDDKIEDGIKAGEAFDKQFIKKRSVICDWKDEMKWIDERYKTIGSATDPENEELTQKLKFLTFDTFSYKLYDDTVEALTRLEKKYDLYILSNATATLDLSFDYLDIRKHFKDIIISSYEQCEKPDKRIYEITLKKIGKEPSQCIFIDDRIKNVEAANNIGMCGYHLVRKKGVNLFDFEKSLEY